MKGVAETALVAIIIAVAAGLVVFGATTYFVVQGKGKISIEACRSNVQLAAKDPTNTVQVNQCYTKNAGDAPAKIVENDNVGNEQVMLKTVAGLLRECKYQFDDGADNDMPWGRNIRSDQIVCFVCSTFTPKYALLNDNLVKVLSNNKIGEQTYLEYLSPSLYLKDSRTLLMSANNEAEEFTALRYELPDKEFAVLAVTNQESIINFASGATDRFIAEKIGEDVTIRDYTHITMVKTAELGNFCDITFLRYP